MAPLTRVGCRDGAELRIHESLDELRTDLADYIADLSETSVNNRGAFAVALSGGSLVGMLRKLCEAPYKKTVDWAKWYIFWVDERLVSKTHVDSNYKLTKDHFLAKLPIVPSHVHSINDTVAAERAAHDYEFVVRQLVRTRLVAVSDISDSPKFDLILLGMGSDGHVASLFPDHPILHEVEQWVSFITDSPEPPPERITFTLPVINSASNVALVVAGADKAQAVHLSIDNDDNVSHNALPSKMIKPTNGKLVWFLDHAAASKLKGLQFPK